MDDDDFFHDFHDRDEEIETERRKVLAYVCLCSVNLVTCDV